MYPLNATRYNTLLFLSGFSFIELMSTLAIVSIVLSVAAPTFSTMMHQGRVNSAQLSFLTALNYARSSSQTVGGYVSVCPTADFESCSNSSGVSGDWATGILVFIEASSTVPSDSAFGQYNLPEDELIKVLKLNSNVIVKAATADGGTPFNSVSFNSLGVPDRAGAFQVSMPKSTSITQKNIFLSRIGRAGTYNLNVCEAP